MVEKTLEVQSSPEGRARNGLAVLPSRHAGRLYTGSELLPPRYLLDLAYTVFVAPGFV